VAPDGFAHSNPFVAAPAPYTLPGVHSSPERDTGRVHDDDDDDDEDDAELQALAATVRLQAEQLRAAQDTHAELVRAAQRALAPPPAPAAAATAATAAVALDAEVVVLPPPQAEIGGFAVHSVVVDAGPSGPRGPPAARPTRAETLRAQLRARQQREQQQKARAAVSPDPTRVRAHPHVLCAYH
jgi:hypothetical protein